MECSICYEEIVSDDTSPYRCTHSFHESCIESWNGTCPMCRASIKSISRQTSLVSTNASGDASDGNEVCYPIMEKKYNILKHKNNIR
jgi:hypothetical protein